MTNAYHYEQSVWLRENAEYWTQRKIPADLTVHQAPGIKFLNMCSGSKNLIKPKNMRLNTRNSNMLINSTSKFKLHKFSFFQYLICSCRQPYLLRAHTCRIWNYIDIHIYIYILNLTKGTCKTLSHLENNYPKRKKWTNNPGQDPRNSNPPTVERYYFTSRVYETVSSNHKNTCMMVDIINGKKRGCAKISNIARNAGPEQVLGSTKTPEIKVLIMFLVRLIKNTNKHKHFNTRKLEILRN